MPNYLNWDILELLQIKVEILNLTHLTHPNLDIFNDFFSCIDFVWTRDIKPNFLYTFSQKTGFFFIYFSNSKSKNVRLFECTLSLFSKYELEVYTKKILVQSFALLIRPVFRKLLKIV